MEILVILSYMLLGGALGVGADWLYWRQKFQQAGEQANARGEALQHSFEEQLAAKGVQLSEQRATLADREQNVKKLEEELAGMRRQNSELENRLHEEGRKLSQAVAASARIPELEAALAESESLVERLKDELSDIRHRAARLEEELAEEKESLQNDLVFVQGGHYLPGRVVRNLTRRERSLDRS
jgi:DNA repair exonuclease SbcCD ATPase subunit